MSDIAISVENVSKQYRLGEVGTGTISHDLNRWWHKVRGKEDPYLRIGDTNDRSAKSDNPYVWALQDINFEVKKGEVLGIIGKNGAGKSTLLKILSRVTSPSTGKIIANGRIASLLEVGTGFHPEMTGRENIYMNGTIMGMSRHEVRAKLDEIVEFAGVDRYLDTPVKRYSSGMTVRLGFAIAAHLDPEILIVDEVLAVGDAEFQKKAIGKMQDVSKGEGRTVLFVSHNMAAIQNICTRGILLSNGRITLQGTAEDIVNSYIKVNSEIQQIKESYDLTSIPRKKYPGHLIFKSASFSKNPLPFGQPIQLKVLLETRKKGFGDDLDFGIGIWNQQNSQLIHFSNRFIGLKLNHQSDEDEYLFEIENNLRPGVFFLTLFLRSQTIIQDWFTGDVILEISDGNPYQFSNTEEIQGSTIPYASLIVNSKN